VEIFLREILVTMANLGHSLPSYFFSCFAKMFSSRFILGCLQYPARPKRRLGSRLVRE
jgi:hypothetical protein